MTSTTSETRSLRADDPGTLVVPASSGEALGGDMASFLTASLKDGCGDSMPTSSADEKLLSDNVLSVGDAALADAQPSSSPWPAGGRRGPVRGKP
ncbi:DUF5949 family protein [Streptomyces sp. NBC_01231]|nr:DUF5949 family protein [Streptomyces sp. NBC_01231]